MRLVAVIVAALIVGLSPRTGVSEDPSSPTTDPLGSPRWTDLRKAFLGEAPAVFDPRVKVSAPLTAENPLSVPISVDVEALEGVEEVLVLADLNPIPKVLSFRPGAARASLGFRVKLQQSTPVRAAARTADGIWHLGGTRVATTGGGCTRPSVGSGSGSAQWQEQLNRVSARLWPRTDGGLRLRLQAIHPMDTGLAPGIPAFHIETLEIADARGRRLMAIYPGEPVAENPLFTVDIPPAAVDGQPIRIFGRDNNGNPIDRELSP